MFTVAYCDKDRIKKKNYNYNNKFCFFEIQIEQNTGDKYSKKNE